MFKVIGALVVYGFAAFGLSVLMQQMEGSNLPVRSGDV